MEECAEEGDADGDARLLHRRDESAAQSRHPVGYGADDGPDEGPELEGLTGAEDERRRLEPQVELPTGGVGDLGDAEEAEDLQAGAEQGIVPGPLRRLTMRGTRRETARNAAAKRPSVIPETNAGSPCPVWLVRAKLKRNVPNPPKKTNDMSIPTHAAGARTTCGGMSGSRPRASATDCQTANAASAAAETTRRVAGRHPSGDGTEGESDDEADHPDAEQYGPAEVERRR